MHLYLKFDGSLEDAARNVVSIALKGWQSELRDGLNLGGGEYFMFRRSGAEVLLVCNDEDHAEVFIEERRDFPFYLYCYGRNRSDELLEQIQLSLQAASVTCELHEET